MLLLIENYKRILITQGLALFFLINGLFIEALGIKASGILFILAFLLTVGYLIFYFLFKIIKGRQIVFKYKNVEYWAALILIATLYLVGSVESFLRNEVLALILIVSLAFILMSICIYYFLQKKSNDNILRHKIFIAVFWFFTGISMLISMISVIVYALETEPSEERLILLKSTEAFWTRAFILIFSIELLVFILVYGYIHFKNRLIAKKETSIITRLGIYGLALFWLLGIVTFVFLLIVDTYRLEIKLDYIEFLVPVYFLILFVISVNWLFKQIKSIIKLKNEKKQIEVFHLQSQVNPHFFFNMLNNLYGLVEENPQKAQELILKLSDTMRYSIYEGQKDSITLGEEIAYLENYIQLHKMRYHKAIDIKFTSDIHDENYKIMPLLFILLVENAFKHGVENLRENAYIFINITSTDNEVQFAIENNFDKTEEVTVPGIGLKNLKRRLELVYPQKHMFTISKTKDKYKAELILKL